MRIETLHASNSSNAAALQILLPAAEPHFFLASYDAIKRNYLPEDDLREIIAVTFLDVVEIQAKIPAASCSLNSRATAAEMPCPRRLRRVGVAAKTAATALPS